MALRRPIALASLVLSLAVVFLAIGCDSQGQSPPPAGAGAGVSPGDPEALARKEFQPAAPMLSPRMAFAYTSFRGRIYVFGGLTAPNWDAATDSIEVYDPLSDTWAVHGKLPVPQSFAAAGVLGDRIYLVGGQILKTRGCPPIDVGTVLAYDPATRRLEERGTLPEPRWGLALLPLDSGLLAVGGLQGPFVSEEWRRFFEPRSPRTDCPSSGGSQILTSTTFIDSDTISAAPSLPQGRALAGQGVLGDVPILMQGLVRRADLPPDHLPIDNRATAFHRETGRWFGSLLPDLEPVWGPASAQASPDAFVVAGGMFPSIPLDAKAEMASVLVKEFTRGADGSLAGSAHLLPPLPDGRGLGGAAVIADKLYVFGGLGRDRDAAPSARSDMVVLRDLTASLPEASHPQTDSPAPTSPSPKPVPSPR